MNKMSARENRTDERCRMRRATKGKGLFRIIPSVGPAPL